MVRAIILNIVEIGSLIARSPTAIMNPKQNVKQKFLTAFNSINRSLSSAKEGSLSLVANLLMILKIIIIMIFATICNASNLKKNNPQSFGISDPVTTAGILWMISL